MLAAGAGVRESACIVAPSAVELADNRSRRDQKLNLSAANLLIGAYYNVVKSTYAGDWPLTTLVTLIF
jgi:hypothetical protein